MIRRCRAGFAGSLFSAAVACASPANPAAQPIAVGSTKQLFIDDRFVEKSTGVALTVNRPRITGEKLIVREHPWEEFFLGAYISVLQDAERIHLWYETADNRTLKDQRGVAYAFSTDGGATWTKPKLGIIDYEGSRENNLVLTKVHGTTVFRNRPDAPAEERYVMFAGQSEAPAGFKGEHKAPNKAFYSADGLTWTSTGPLPFVDLTEWRALHHFHLDSQNVMFWDTRLNQYVFMPRINTGDTRKEKAGRTVGRAVSDRFGGFSKPEIVFQRDEADHPNMDFYTSATIQYPFAADAYLMFPAAYHHYPTPPHPGNYGPIDIQFAVSRDGARWQRPDRRPIIPLGADGSWNGGSMYAGYGLSRQGDELSLYYTAYDVAHGGYRGRGYLGGIISRAVYRLDGFTSMDAGYAQGEFTTPVIVFDGERLQLNFDGSAGGWAQIEIQDREGKAISGFAAADAEKVVGNFVTKAVAWGGKTDLSALRGQPVRLRIIMRDAKLYAFQFVRAKG